MEVSDIRAFARTVDLGNLSAAARSLGLPKSTISRSLTRLEADVGATLVDRSSRHLRLTDAGVLFRPFANRILSDVDEAGTALDNFVGIPRGKLRVSVPFTFAVALVAPMLPAFLCRYPEVTAVLAVENRVIDLSVEPADLVIRVGALPDSELIARHLMTSEAWTCASPDYLARRGTPVSISDLTQHAIVGHADRTTLWTYQFRNQRTEHVKLRPALVVSDSVALEPALIGGAGIGQLPDFIADPAVRRGTLVRLFPETRGDVFDIHALYTSHRSLSAKVRVFIDALVAHLGNRQFSANSGVQAGDRTEVKPIRVARRQ